MPQMSPLMWSNLFILFSLLILVAMIKIYFLFKPEILSAAQNNTQHSNQLLNWMW